MIKQYYLEEFQVRAIFVPAEHRRELAALSETPQPVRIYYGTPPKKAWYLKSQFAAGWNFRV